jgi:hypothetical protein
MGTLGAGVAVAITQVVALLLIAPGLWRVLRADHGQRIRTNEGIVG